jgi:glycosyltransferase involved in cell wall biosynthesis
VKIAYLCSDVDVPLFGSEGCSVHVRAVTEALSRAGHDVFIVCSTASENPTTSLNCRYYELAPSGLDATALRLVEEEPLIQNNFLERDLRSVLFNSWLQSAGAALFQREQPDFIYERYALFGWAGAQLASQFQIPLLLEVNAPLCDEQDGFDRFTLVNTARQMEAQVLRAADAVLPVSKWLKHWIAGQGVLESKIEVIPNAVSAHLFSASLSGSEIRLKHHLDGSHVLGYVGSFQDWHDVGGLLTAFSKISSSNQKVALLLVGEGPFRGKMQRRASELGLNSSVVFTGNVPHESVPEYLAAMDIAVVPYDNRPDFYFSPIKLFESMAAGTATVAADIGQIGEMIENGRTGVLYQPGSTDSLVTVIQSLLDNANLRKRIAEAGREFVLLNHTWDAVASKIVTIAQQSIEAKRDR